MEPSKCDRNSVEFADRLLEKILETQPNLLHIDKLSISPHGATSISAFIRQLRADFINMYRETNVNGNR